jgi:choline kinase
MGFHRPKCLLEFGGTTLLERIVTALRGAGVDDVAIVLGYEREAVEAVRRRFSVAWRVVYNEDYATTNTIHSLWLAREWLDDDFIYFNADVLFDPRIVLDLAQAGPSTLAVDVKRCGEEEVKVVVDAGGRVTRIGKALAPGDCLGEFIGIGKFARSVGPALIESLRRFNEETHERNLFFEAAVDVILGEHVFRAAPLGDRRAIEIDSPDDFRRAQAMHAGGLFP